MFASEESLSFSQIKTLLPSIQENRLNYHLNVLKEGKLIKNEKKREYKRSEFRSYYALSEKSKDLLNKLGLIDAKEDFQTLFKKLT